MGVFKAYWKNAQALPGFNWFGIQYEKVNKNVALD